MCSVTLGELGPQTSVPLQHWYLDSLDGGMLGMSVSPDKDLFGWVWPLGRRSQGLLAWLLRPSPRLAQDDDGSRQTG